MTELENTKEPEEQTTWMRTPEELSQPFRKETRRTVSTEKKQTPEKEKQPFKPQGTAELDELEVAAALLQNPRATDNTTFKGREVTAQQNDTLDLLEQVKRQVREDRVALARLKSAGLSPDKDLSKEKLVRRGQFATLKGAEVLARTRDALTLVKGRTLFIYELKRLELQAPAQGLPGETLDLRWPERQEKAVGSQAQEQEMKRRRGRSQREGY